MIASASAKPRPLQGPREPEKMNVQLSGLSKGLKDIGFSRTAVVLVALIATGLYVFLQLADEMSEAEIEGFDRTIFLMFRNPADITDPLGPPWFEETMTEITSLGGYPILVALIGVVAGYLLVVRKYGPALYLVLSTGIGASISHVLKMLYDRPRPDLVEHLVTTQTASFPSGHATMSTVVYLTLAALIVRLVEDRSARIYVFCVAIFVSIAVGISRIYLGVHWPSDVAAGWALGAAWASLSWLVLALLRARRNATRTSAGDASAAPR
jgi:undecaprenyl-diphosphatase